MFDEKFEEFLLEQVRRESLLYYGIMITFACCAIACFVMGVAALIIYGEEAVSIVIRLIGIIVMLVGFCYGCKSVAGKSREAAEEMANVLEHLKDKDQPEYSEETKEARRVACKNLHSIWGLIISYGVIALMLWAVTLLLVCLVVYADLTYGALLGAFATFSIALALTILTIAYICDLPAARRYRNLIEICGQEE